MNDANIRSLLRLNNALQVLTNGAWYVATPFIPLYLVAQGASAGVVGVVVGCSGIAPLLVSIHAGALVDERGPAVVTKISVILFAAAGVILTIGHGIWPTAVAYALMAVANIGFAVAPQAIVAAVSTDATRIRNYGYYSLSNSAGAVAGPILGGLLAGRFGYAAAFSVVWIMMLPSFAVAASLHRAPKAPRHGVATSPRASSVIRARETRDSTPAPGVATSPRASSVIRARGTRDSTPAPMVSIATAHTLVGTILRQRGVGAILFISGMMVCAQALQQSFFPLYLSKVGLPAPLIGLVVAAGSLGGMAVRTLLAGGVSWLGYAGSLIYATGLVAIAFGVTPFLRGFWPLACVSAFVGANMGFTMPLSMSLLVESVTAEFWGVALGIRQCVQRLGAIVSPFVFGFVSTARGIESAFYVGAAAFLGATAIMARVGGQIRRPEGAPPP